MRFRKLGTMNGSAASVIERQHSRSAKSLVQQPFDFVPRPCALSIVEGIETHYRVRHRSQEMAAPDSAVARSVQFPVQFHAVVSFPSGPIVNIQPDRRPLASLTIRPAERAGQVPRIECRRLCSRVDRCLSGRFEGLQLGCKVGILGRTISQFPRTVRARVRDALQSTPRVVPPIDCLRPSDTGNEKQ